MGYPMAGYISKGGHNVTVFNRTKSKAEKWIKEYKGKMAETPAEAAKDAEYIFTCVGNDNDLREVTFGDNGAFKTIKKDAIYVDNTTASATIAREIYEHAKKNGSRITKDNWLRPPKMLLKMLILFLHVLEMTKI